MKLRFSNLKYSFRCLGVLIKAHPWFLFSQILSVIFLVFETLIPINIVQEILTAYKNGGDLKQIIIIVSYNIAIIIACEVANKFIDYLVSFIQAHFTLAFATVLFNKLYSIDYDFHENPKFLDNYTRALDNGAENIYNVAHNQMELIKTTIRSIAIFVIIIQIHWIAVLYTLVIALVYMICRRTAGEISFNRMTEVRPYQRKRWYIARTYFVKDAIPDIKITDINDIMIKEHNQILKDTIRVYNKHTWKIVLVEFFGSSFMVSIYPFILGTVCYFVLGMKDVTVLAKLTVAASMLHNFVKSFTQIITNIQIYALETRIPFEVLDMESQIEGKGGLPLDNEFESLKVENASFAYIDDNYVLNDISFYVKKGEKIAIVGHNGAGKTTLVKLLLRLYDVNKGDIKVNDINYKELDPKSLRLKVGAVFQNSEIYSVSVAENILLRKMETKEDEELVVNALKFSGIYDYVQTLPEGINTMVTREFMKEGAMFSGGQIQKIAVARGYAQNYELFILDEPSSALDPIAEAEMYHNMLKLGEDRTLIFISHRLSATANVDRIYLFENGRIAEAGTHEELMSIEGGKYREMFASQSEKYLGAKHD